MRYCGSEGTPKAEALRNNIACMLESEQRTSILGLCCGAGVLKGKCQGKWNLEYIGSCRLSHDVGVILCELESL